MNAKLRNGLVIGSALTAVFLSQVACGGSSNLESKVAPINTPEIVSVENIAVSPLSGMGCRGLYEMTGAYNAMSYNDFVKSLQKENPNSNGLDIYFNGETPNCGITASPTFGYNPVDKEYSFSVPFYEENNLKRNIEVGAVRIVPEE